MSSIAEAAPRNQVVGTWRMVAAEIERDGKVVPAYGQRPSGMLIFAPDMHYVEVLTDGDLPRFASNLRGQGTDEENRTAMATSIGMFGSYTVDENGDFTGDRVEGSTFPNWVGSVRTQKDIRIVVNGDQMTNYFTRPDGTKITIILSAQNSEWLTRQTRIGRPRAATGREPLLCTRFRIVPLLRVQT